MDKIKVYTTFETSDGAKFDNRAEAMEHQADMDLISCLVDIAATEDWTSSECDKLEILLQSRLSGFSGHFREYHNKIKDLMENDV